ncbi:pyridoxal phosphate-dependent aminotransferase [Thermovenabulum gondwanense]|uniref:Threonine-phosphate decarboxylase n=1 Tax=Thermovenabulum gondwanense TaxID=520767 RepID=A0A162N0R8_9FIRM|nr:histidinol-phosphate transaminase [Thermovenabulum gondwanense]KYO68643.1 Threonine-phosphate decarboxylase [Thermovenabulum gondwanense]
MIFKISGREERINIHGGDIYSYDRDLIDFSSNINPLGIMEGLEEYLSKNLKKLSLYPDIKYRRLKKNIADYLNINEDEVIIGNGAVEIINNMILMFNRVVVFVPCFSEYILRTVVLGKNILKLSLDEEFRVKSSVLPKILKKGDLLILGNPNNPTGLRIEKQELIKIAKIVEDKEAFLLLDEAFYEFCEEDYDSIKLFYNSKNVCIIRAATKFFALPGIRLGYAFANKDFVKTYLQYELPWNVNSIAEAAADYIFKNRDYIIKSKNYIKQQREMMYKHLSKIKDVKVFRTNCNFFLLKLLKYDEEYVFERLLEKNILIRKCSNFEGLDKSYIRVAVKKEEENTKLIEGLKKCFE